MLCVRVGLGVVVVGVGDVGFLGICKMDNILGFLYIGLVNVVVCYELNWFF